MKKKLLIPLTLFIFLFSMIGCSGSEKETKQKQDAPTLTYMGHASVKIVSKEGDVVYIDPSYSDGDYSETADVILVTHEHSDHNKVDLCAKDDNTIIIRSSDALQEDAYKSYDFGNIKIQATPSGGNPNHSISNCVGYIVTVDGINVFHAGDTSKNDKTELLKGQDIDYAMYPIDGKYNMDAKEATEVANLIGANKNIPNHEYDSGNTKKSDNFTPENRLILEYGQTLKLEKLQ